MMRRPRRGVQMCLYTRGRAEGDMAQHTAPSQPVVDASNGHSPARPTPEERAAQGRSARRRAPRSSHAAWAAAPDRADPVKTLTAQGDTRVPELVPIRYGR